MTPLERRYRRLLRVLPRWYRADREEEMVEVFLADRADRPNADLDLEHGSPGLAEVRATVGLSVRARFAATRTAGDVARLIAVVGLLAQFVITLPGMVHVVRFAFVMDDASIARALAFDVVSMAPIVLLLLGHRRTARIVAVLAVAPSLLWISNWVPMTVAVQLPFWLATFCLLVGFHREAPPLRPAPWWWALLATTAVTVGWLVLASPFAAPASLQIWLLVAGGTIWLVLARSAAVALAVTVFAVSFLPLPFLQLQEFEYREQLVQLAATGALVVVSAVVAMRAGASAVREASTA